MDIATIIRQARNAADMSQQVLADKLKLSKGAVGQWETSLTLPSLENRIELSRILNIPIAQLMPELENNQEISVSDPQARELVLHFLMLPAGVRAAILLNVKALTESFDLGPATQTSPPPTLKSGL